MRLTIQTGCPSSSSKGLSFRLLFLGFLGGFVVLLRDVEEVGRLATDGVLPAEGGTTGGKTAVTCG